MKNLLIVATGGAVGSSLRYLLCGAVARWIPAQGMLLGTLAVNVTGGFVIGYLAGGLRLEPWMRTGMVVGVLGGFTTFSAFSWDTLSLATQAGPRGAVLNLAANVVLSLLAAWAGARASGGL